MIQVLGWFMSQSDVVMNRPTLNEARCSGMSWGRMGESLLATILVMILKEKFNKLMGL